MKACVLAIDLGGTKTLCQLSTSEDILLEREYPSADFPDFDALLTRFLAESVTGKVEIMASCIAIAGPIFGHQAKVTNLPWQLDQVALSQQFNIGTVHFCNDFEAVARGIAGLRDTDLMCLQQGELPRASKIKAVIGAGTGLGQAVIIPQQDKPSEIMATEGGHVDFAPKDERQWQLLKFVNDLYPAVSYECILSGSGLELIYRFLAQRSDIELPQAMQNAMDQEGGPAWISHQALQHLDLIAVESLDLFVDIYGAQAGNLALNTLSYDGLYIAGGIAAKNHSAFSTGRFMEAFLRKGKMAKLMTKIPVYLILQPKVGLFGAREIALTIVK